MTKQILILAVSLLAMPYPCIAATHRVSSPAELSAICRTIQPGDTIVLSDGTYTDRHFILAGKGTEEHPITLQAETAGKVVLNGASRLSIGGEYLVVEGLQFRGGAIRSKSIIEFRVEGMPPTRHCVLRNTAIIDYNPDRIDTRYYWVSLYGTDHIVEQCWFSGQTHSGVTVCVWLDGDRPARHALHRNYFGNRPRGNANGFETIRIGDSPRSMTNARCVVSENLFEECDGEIEIISNKSCENTYTRNTFLNCSGCLTLRHGNRCNVEDNVFIGGNARGAGGVRVIGEGHRIAGNYFSGTRGRAGGAISLQTGIPDSPLSGYFQVRDCVIDSNTFADNPGALFALDAGYGEEGCELLPEGVTISNSLMVVPRGAKPMIAAANPPSGIVWKDNLAVGGELGLGQLQGIKFARDVPSHWKNRLEPQSLGRADVGPEWMRHPGAEDTGR
ncbi:MAG: polysaccharide lyase 6 family protein [Candidatus Latescibacteria bacterium]|nr:polysaccharide lyase 6 family protein [Candidatus Latescibacterota bacterium]